MLQLWNAILVGDRMKHSDFPKCMVCANRYTAFHSAQLYDVAGGTDLTEGDRQDLQQLEQAVRGRLLELQLLKLSAQSQAGQAQHASLLDVGTSTAQPKVGSLRCHLGVWQGSLKVTLACWSAAACL